MDPLPELHLVRKTQNKAIEHKEKGVVGKKRHLCIYTM